MYLAAVSVDLNIILLPSITKSLRTEFFNCTRVAIQISRTLVTDGSSPYEPSLSMKITKVHQTESQIAAKNWNQPQ